MMWAENQSNKVWKDIALIKTVDEMRACSRKIRAEGKSIGLVPTMGALHEGHLSLVRFMLQETDKVAVSIFVNPAQFGPGEDLEAYPRQLEQDIALLQREGAHIVYCPDVKEMYPDDFATKVSVSGVSEGLCGEMRPGHFEGVATVVAKLLLQVEPDKAIFGEKDYQQLCVIRRLVKDLDLPCDVLAGEVVRDEHGLALSSRNAYLDDAQIKTARSLNTILKAVRDDILSNTDVGKALDKGRQSLIEKGFEQVEYLELRDAIALNPLAVYQSPARLLVAVRLGPARLIDNIPV